MTSLKDVARMAGVAVGTVSRYLNEPERLRESTRRRIEPAIAALGYSPNSVARSLLVKEVPSVRWSSAEVRDIILSRAADGVVVLGCISPFDFEGGGGESRYPPVVVGAEIVSTAMRQLPSVRIDNVAASEELTRYLVDLGHRRIAFMSGEQGSHMMDDREIGFRTVLAARGIPIPRELLAYGDLIITGGRRATRAMMSRADPPTAIVCANDEMAIGAIVEARSMGLTVPGDVSIVGFDDIRYAEVTDPPLTTVAQPREEIGERCFLRLLHAMENTAVETGVEVVPHRLVIRKSAAPPRGQPAQCTR
jgi:LacI family repressor for deo operon, udp, cdd, tsx, nupC, and nupG